MPALGRLPLLYPATFSSTVAVRKCCVGEKFDIVEERNAPMGTRFQRVRSSIPLRVTIFVLVGSRSWSESASSDERCEAAPRPRTEALRRSFRSRSIVCEASTGEKSSATSPDADPSVTERPEAVDTLESARDRREGVAPSSCSPSA